MTPRDWHESDEAKRLLAEMDAAERQSDRYSGFGWDAVARAFNYQARELEGELDDLRAEAIGQFADAAGPQESNAWYDAWDEADSEAETVDRAAARARREHWGDSILEEAA